MITYLKGDIFSSPAQVLVNTVNTVGVMGKGVALEFKKRYPEMFSAYERVCKAKQLEIGKLFLWKGPEKWVLMFPTKVHWRNPSKIEYIEAGLQKFSATYADKGITSAAFPRLGCGNGGLDWKQVQPLMEQYLKICQFPSTSTWGAIRIRFRSISNQSQWNAGSTPTRKISGAVVFCSRVVTKGF